MTGKTFLPAPPLRLICYCIVTIIMVSVAPPVKCTVNITDTLWMAVRADC